MSSAQFALTAAVIGGLLLLATGPGYRLHLLSHGAALLMVLISGGAGLVALATAGQTLVVARTEGTEPWLAVGAAALGLVVVAFPAIWVTRAVTEPWVNDVSTDPDDPPAIDRKGTVPVVNTTVLPLTLELPASQVFQMTRTVAEELGWTITNQNAATGLIAALAVTRWFGFIDDVVVRIRPSNKNHTRVDMRSASRVGISDLGTNARRICLFLKALHAMEVRDTHSPP